MILKSPLQVKKEFAMEMDYQIFQVVIERLSMLSLKRKGSEKLDTYERKDNKRMIPYLVQYSRKNNLIKEEYLSHFEQLIP